MEEATALKWLKIEGDQVAKGEAILQIETDKATMEVESSASGFIRKLLVREGDSVLIRTPIAIIGAADESINEMSEMHLHKSGQNDLLPASSSPTGNVRSGSLHADSSPLRISPRARRLADEKGVQLNLLAGKGTGPEGRVIERDVDEFIKNAALSLTAQSALSNLTNRNAPRITPLAVRVAEDLGIDLESLSLGLPGSRVRSEDVLRHADSANSRTSITEVVVPDQSAVIFLKGIRKRVAESVLKSVQTIPSVTLVIEIDMTECAEMRERIIPDFEKRHDVRLSFNDLFAVAVARCLELHPLLNSSLVGDEISLHAAKNIGFAVAIEGGLVIPVLKQVGEKGLGAIAKERKSLTERALSGTFTPEDLAGGTFTISNLGSFGIDLFDPIIPPGQCAILGIGRIADRPAVIAKRIVVRSLMNLCLSFDHRILDGAPAALFLASLKELLENPVRILV